MSILGNRVVRVEDPRFLRGEGRYVENLELDGALAVTFVRSPLAHARVNAVDASAAAALPNVQVFSGADVDAHPFGPPPHWHITAGMERPLVARDVVRFAGDIVAIVVSEDRASGLDAAEHVVVDYDPLPAALSVEEAVEANPGEASMKSEVLFMIENLRENSVYASDGRLRSTSVVTMPDGQQKSNELVGTWVRDGDHLTVHIDGKDDTSREIDGKRLRFSKPSKFRLLEKYVLIPKG